MTLFETNFPFLWVSADIWPEFRYESSISLSISLFSLTSAEFGVGSDYSNKLSIYSKFINWWMSLRLTSNLSVVSFVWLLFSIWKWNLFFGNFEDILSKSSIGRTSSGQDMPQELRCCRSSLGLPLKTQWPPFERTYNWSKVLSKSEFGWCMDVTIAIWCLSTNCLRHWTTWAFIV